MSAFDAVDGASSAASKWYRMIASKPERFKELMPGNEIAFEVFKELARTRRRNADTVDPGIGSNRLGQRTLKCVFLIGTLSAHSIRASMPMGFRGPPQRSWSARPLFSRVRASYGLAS